MSGYAALGGRRDRGVIDLREPHGPFQLIGLRTRPETILPPLDFGMCRIGYDGAEVTRTPEYLQDQAAQTFTLVRCDDDSYGTAAFATSSA